MVWAGGMGKESSLSSSRRENRESVCVCSIQPFFSYPHSISREKISQALLLLVLVWLSEGFQLTFFPPTLLFSPRFRPLADCRKKTRGEGKTVCSRSLFHRRKRRKNKENFYFIFYSSPRNSKTQKGWNLWVVESSEKFFTQDKIRNFILRFSWRWKIVFEEKISYTRKERENYIEKKLIFVAKGNQLIKQWKLVIEFWFMKQFTE